MWIFTPIGFFSVVSCEGFPGVPPGKTLMIRARDPGDLDRLRDSYLPGLGPNVEVPGRDYPVRAFSTHQEFADCLSKLALEIDYTNFKDTVAARQGYARASVYGKVWQDCLKIQPALPTSGKRPARLGDGAAEYRSRDLHAEGDWPLFPKPRYGGVVFDGSSRVLLREPRNHFDGYYWTFAKGAAEKGEHPVDAALREVREETTYEPDVIGHVTGVFKGGHVGASNYFYVMQDPRVQIAIPTMENNAETSALCWATQRQASQLISKSTNQSGRDRDLRILAAAYQVYQHLRHGTTQTAT
jgi:hypothetical protein